MITIRDMEGSGIIMQPYIHWQHKFNERLVLNAGIHYHHFMMNHTNSLEPRAGIRYTFLPNHTLSFGFGRHSQILPVNIYHIESFDGNQYVKPNEDAEMLKSDHYVLGYDLNITDFTRLKIEGYYQRLFDVPVNGRFADSYSMLNEGANFGVFSPDTLLNQGAGENIGIELTMERFFHDGFYYLITGSVFDSKYRASDGRWRSTAFNNNYVGNVLAGYEFKVGSSESKRNVIDFNIKATYAGGQRYVPFDVFFDEQNQLYGRAYRHDDAFSVQYKDYFRADLSVGFKMSTGNVTQEWMLEITNVFNNRNIFNIGFNQQTGEEFFNYQLGMMVIPQWRIRF